MTRLDPLAVSLLLAIVTPACADGAGEGAAGGDWLGVARAAVTCDPRLLHYPVAGPHNGGYDGHWNDFQCNPHPASAPDNSDYIAGRHHGNDIFAPLGTPIVAVTDGVVVRAGWPTSTSGNRVTIQDACGWLYYAGHMDTITVAEGTFVHAGDPIGTVGHTGTTTQPHCHFNVDRGDFNDDIDPFPLLQSVDATACGPDPRCGGRTEASWCATASVIATCRGGAYSEGDCAVYGTLCQETLIGTICRPHVNGLYESSTFPGGTDVTVGAGEEVHGCLEYTNNGSMTWQPGHTFLGTTVPRERASVAPGSDWPSATRIATVERDTPLGERGRFCFAVRGTTAPGERDEHFSLVHEHFRPDGSGQIWAADVRGLADDHDLVHVRTVSSGAAPPPSSPPPSPPPLPPPSPPPPPETPADAGPSSPPSEPSSPSAPPAPPSAPLDEPEPDPEASTDAGAHATGAHARPVPAMGGCSMAGATSRPRGSAAALAMLCALFVARPRRRRPSG